MAVKIMRGEKRTQIRAPRVPVDLEVDSRTIGTAANYRLMTEDISRSGLLLVWDRDLKVPFIINTLLEITIDPNSQWLGKPVMCLGKVVRRESAAEEGGTGHSARLGVQIVQIEHTDLHEWEGCLSELEQKFGVEPAGRSMLIAS